MTITLSKILLLFTLVFVMLGLVACDESDNSESGNSGEENSEKLVMPDADSVSRDFIEFDSIVYSRPDYEKLIADIEETTNLINENEVSFEEQVDAILSLEEGYSAFRTMHTYNVIATSKDSSDSAALEEYVLLSSVYPDVMAALENMMVAAATSPHAEKFEEEYFGDGLIEEYRNGGIYTNEVIALLKEEARLEAEYSSLSPATVEITYEGVTDTFNNTEQRLSDKYGKNSQKYQLAIMECELLYAEREREMTAEIFVELTKVRRLIADELGYDTYATYAYDTIYHDYSPEDADAFLDDIANYVIPIYKDLESTVFNSYFHVVSAPRLSRERLVNTLYSTYLEVDSELAEIYAYMLLGGYYDVGYAEDYRSGGAYTTYLDDYSSPFIFATVDGNIADLATLAHEFGHFADAYINNNSPASLDTLEVSSQALELMTVELMKNKLSASEYRYLLYSEIQSTFLALIYQGFYATFERELYKLDYEDISEESLRELVKSVAKDMGLPQYNLEVVFIDHIFLYPFYVQSYCTSIVSALDIYFEECENAGEGVRIYKDLIDRDGEFTFVEEVVNAGLESPFEENKLKELSNKLYYKINGYSYYKNAENSDKVA